MRKTLRRGLIWTLAIAMMVAGLPLAHAQNCDTLHVESAQHALHQDMQMGDVDVTAMDHAPSQQHHDSPAPTPCKCLNCSSLCAAFVASMPRMVQLERRADAVVYAAHAAVQREAAVFIDPGIPIAV